MWKGGYSLGCSPLFEMREKSMNYQEAIDWIHSREKFKVKPGLKRMEWMMQKLGNPHESLSAIHVAGTNGKGSTVSFLRNLLQSQGYNVGTFTSPYIIQFNERISTNGNPISDSDLASLVTEIKPLADQLKKTSLGEPTEFEVITAMAMLYFYHQKLDYVLFEAGLGGRYDSTNIIEPIISLITNIGLDHMNILGGTYEQIAYEKAGIIKPQTPVICGVKQPDALKVIERQATDLGAPLYVINYHFDSETKGEESGNERFLFKSATFHSGILKSPMRGEHQVDNAALAIQAMETLRDSGHDIDRNLYGNGINNTFWPARFETIRKLPLTIIDGAHNEEGTRALVNTVKRYYGDKKIYLVYAALEDKPVKKMLDMMEDIVEKAIFTTFDFPRAMKPEELKRLSSIEDAHCFSDYKHAVDFATEQVTDDELILITGSLYFISNIRKYFELV